MTSTPWRDKDVLYELYWDQELDQGQIAGELGCSRATVKKWFNRHNLDTRSQSDVVELAHEKHGGDHPWRDKDTLEKLYFDERMSLSEVASELGCLSEDVRRWMEKFGLERRGLSESHRNYTATFYTNKEGYEVSCSSNAMRESPDEVRIHRLVAVAEYGFDEVVGKDVHHKNGIRWDNRHENITAMTPSEHMCYHQEKKHNIDDTSYREEQVLYELYVEEGRSISDIAEKYDVSDMTIHKWLVENGIERRSVGGG